MSLMSKILTPRKRSFDAAGNGLARPLFRRLAVVVAETLGTAIQPTVWHFYRHEQKIFVNRGVALSTRTDHRSQQAGLRWIGDVIDAHAIKISLK